MSFLRVHRLSPSAAGSRAPLLGRTGLFSEQRKGVAMDVAQQIGLTAQHRPGHIILQSDQNVLAAAVEPLRSLVAQDSARLDQLNKDLAYNVSHRTRPAGDETNVFGMVEDVAVWHLERNSRYSPEEQSILITALWILAVQISFGFDLQAAVGDSVKAHCEV